MKLSNLYRSYHAGIFWQRPVISKSVSDPDALSPQDGDRYIVGSNPPVGSAWEGKEDQFAEYNGSTWEFVYPIQSHACLVEDEDRIYLYSYGEWVSIGKTFYSDEEIQDAVGDILDDGSVERIVFTYDDTNNIISADFNEFDVNHDLLNNYFANEHIDWTTDQGSTTNIHEENVTSLSVTQHEEDIDHDALTNFVANEHINHSDVSITSSGILSGGGDLTSSRDINLEHSDVDHDQTTNFLANEHIDWTSDQGTTTNIHDNNITSSSVTQHEGDIDHNSLTNTHQNVYTDSSPQFSSVTITSSITDGGEVTTKDYVDNLVQGIDWQESVISFYDPSSGLPSSPTDGDRYISTATANGWEKDNIYEWDNSNSVWIEIIVESGYATWVESDDKQYVYNSGSWNRLASIYTHNNLSGLQGGISGERYHLQSSAYNNLSSQDQTVYTTSDVVFDDISITNPTSAYNLNHDSFSGFVSNEHIDHSNVSITGGTGISGGGDLTSSRTLSLDFNSLTTETSTDSTNDYVSFYDSSAGTHKNITPDNLIGSIESVYSSVSDNGTQVVGNASDINFSTNLNVSDDGDSTVTVTSPNDYIDGVSGSGDGTLTISRSDGSDFTADLSHTHSEYATSNDYVNSASGTGDGTLTLSRTDGTDVTADLSHSHSEYLENANNLSDVDNAATAIDNLGALDATENLTDVENTATSIDNLGALDASENLSDVNDAVVSATNLQELTEVELNGDFDSGQYLQIIRNGNLVTVAYKEHNLNHSDMSNPVSNLDLIPSNLQPVTSNKNCIESTNHLVSIKVDDNGAFSVERKNHDGTDQAWDSTSGGFSITYFL